ESLIDINECDDKVAAKLFKVLILSNSPVRRTISCIPSEKKCSWKAIKEAIVEERRPLRDSKFFELISARRKEKESVAEFAQYITRLVDIVYDNFDEEVRAVLSRDFLLARLDQKIRYKLLDAS
ncbi:hypothetical protein QU765_24160, partial [Escherichia coli]|nr:hypothetical protein [Escherichia coli]